MNKSVAEKRLAEARIELEKVSQAYDRALNAQSWSTWDGSSRREVTNANITSLYNQKLALEKKVEKLESYVEGLSCGAIRLGARY